ncbi:MAG: rod shape-determining protein MreC [Lachnospiraceae bacterium]|nr:rod shape-determining protein MreC [Lachnospiraceae bacterium]
MSPIVKKKGEKFTIPGKYLLFILTILCCVLMVVCVTTDVISRPINSVLGYVVVPYQRGISNIGSYLKDRKSELVNIRDLINENATLREKINELEIENTKLMQDKYELNSLRELYELDMTYDTYRKVGASVIYCDSGNWFSTFIVDKGYKDGIEPDMNVVAGKGLVGRVTIVGPNWSKITSIISDNFNVSGKLISTSENLIVSGNLESLSSSGVIPFSQLIDADSKVTKGDKIVTSDISNKYLPGLIIGYVDSITNDSNNLTKSGYLIPVIDFEHLDNVLIILDKKQEITPEDEEKGFTAIDFEDNDGNLPEEPSQEE